MCMCVCRGEAFLVLLLKCCCCCSIINYFHIMPVEQWKYNMCDVALPAMPGRVLATLVIVLLLFLNNRLYWKRVIAQYRGWTVVFQICTMYTAFLDKEIFHQSPGRRSRWHWLHPLKCLCCSWCCAADLVLLCTKLRSCSSRQQSDTTDKYADQNRNLT